MSASMSGILSSVPGLNKLVGPGKSQTVNVKSVDIHHIENDPDRRARNLKHLIKANHSNYSIFDHEASNRNAGTNKSVTALSAAYLIGATQEQLNDLYETQIKVLGPWRPSPAEVVDNDFSEFLGDTRYARAYLDYFEDKLAMEFAYDWKKVVLHHLLVGKHPLIDGLLGISGHAIIRLAYALQMDNKELGMEGLALAAIHYRPVFKNINAETAKRPENSVQKPLFALLMNIVQDDRFQASSETAVHIDEAAERYEAEILEYWNAWDITNATEQFEQAQRALTSAVNCSYDSGAGTCNVTLAEVLSTTHGLRVLLPSLPARHHASLLRQWWMFTILKLIVGQKSRLYVAEPTMDISEKDWKYVQHKTLNSPWSHDAVALQAIETMMVASQTWDDKDYFYLRSAINFVDKFQKWQA